MRTKLMLLSLLIVWASFYFLTNDQGVPNAEIAIQRSQQYKTIDEKVDYLVWEAQAFLAKEDRKSAQQIAEYILKHVDGESKDARALQARLEQQSPSGAI